MAYSKQKLMDLINNATRKYGEMCNHTWAKMMHENNEISDFLNYNQVKELYNIVKAYMDKYGFIFGEPYIGMNYDECGEPKFIDFIIPTCNWEEWDNVDKYLHTRMHSLKGYMLIVCIKGLTD